MTKELHHSRFDEMAAPIIAEPNGVSMQDAMRIWGLGLKMTSQYLNDLVRAGLIKKSHDSRTPRGRWTSPKNARALRDKIDREQPTREIVKRQRVIVRKHAAEYLRKMELRKLREDRELDAWLEKPPARVMVSHWQPAKPPGPRWVFDLA